MYTLVEEWQSCAMQLSADVVTMFCRPRMELHGFTRILMQCRAEQFQFRRRCSCTVHLHTLWPDVLPQGLPQRSSVVHLNVETLAAIGVTVTERRCVLPALSSSAHHGVNTDDDRCCCCSSAGCCCVARLFCCDARVQVCNSHGQWPA